MMAEEFKGQYYIEYIRGNMKYNLKSDTFCRQVPSLKYQMNSKYLIYLWRDKIAQALPNQLNIEDTSIKMNIFEEEILKEISHLMLPLNCKEDLERRNSLIKEQIQSFFVNQNHFLYFTSLEKFYIYFDSICWTPQGTINLVRTANQIIENTTLSTIEKYVLACNNCLKKKIQELLKILPKDFITDYEDNKYFLVQFWTFYSRGDHEKLSKLANGKEIWIYLLEQSFLFLNEVAVQFVFNNFSITEEEIDTVMENAIESIEKNSNIGLFLWQEVAEFQSRMMDIDMNKRLLLKLHHISEWCSVPPLSKYIHELIKHFNICDTFDIIIFCWLERIIDLRQYITFWNELTLNFKLDFENNFDEIFDVIFQSCLEGEKKDFLTVKFLMNKSTSENIRKKLYWNEKYFCRSVICFGGPGFLDNLICQVLKAKRRISAFKNMLLNVHGLSVISELVVSSKFEWVEEFICKFCAENKRTEFKNYLPYVENSIIIKYISLETDKFNIDFLTALNKFLNWHFKSNEEDTCRYISIVFDLESDSFHEQREKFFEAIRDFIEKEKWEFVERYWKWIYSATREEIGSTKGKLTRMIKILLLSSKGQCISPSMKFFSRHKLFKRLATCCFKPDELEDLKELGVRNHLQFLVIELLENDRHQEVNDLMDWFFSSDETIIDEFKTAFMLSHLGRTFLYNSIKKDPNLNKIIFLFKKWLNYSADSIILFHHRFVNFVKIKVDSERQNLDQNKRTRRQIVDNWVPLNKNIKKCLDLLEELLPENPNVAIGKEGIVRPIAKRKARKRAREVVPFQRKKLRLCLNIAKISIDS